jgi:hypothetical protein
VVTSLPVNEQPLPKPAPVWPAECFQKADPAPAKEITPALRAALAKPPATDGEKLIVALAALQADDLHIEKLLEALGLLASRHDACVSGHIAEAQR